VPREEPGRFDAILSTGEVERLGCETGIRTPAFRLVRDGAPLPAAAYTGDGAWHPAGLTRMGDVGRGAAEHAAGATIVLQALHLHWRPRRFTVATSSAGSASRCRPTPT